MKKSERNLFVAIAGYAIDKGCRVSLERKREKYDSKALNGALSQSVSTDGGLILRIKPPKEETE